MSAPTDACILAALALTVAACGGDGSTHDDVDAGDADAATAALNSRAAVEAVAAAVYDAVHADTDVDAYVEAVMAAFSVPALTEPAELDARVTARLPAFMLPQTLDLAAAYAAGQHVELDNLVAALAERGVHRAGGGAVDRAFLDERWAAIAAAPAYDADQVLPALVLALSAERARRNGLPAGAGDPLWGDGLLDPLQTTLLLYALGAEVSGVAAPPPSPRRVRPAGEIRDFVLDQIAGEAQTRVLDGVEWPTAPEELAQAAPCVSLALYGHRVGVAVSPDILYHQQVDNASPPAFVTRVDVRVEFLDDYWDNYPQTKGWIYTTLMGLAGCTMPRQGTVPGKPLTWSVGDDLAGHGAYDITAPATDGDGQATASWRTVPETTPAMHRTLPNLEVAVDWMKVRATNLVPGWNNLALVAGGLKRAPDTGVQTLRVRYYKNPCAGGLRTAIAGPAQCIDEWRGGAELTYTQPDGSYTITASDLVWRPTLTGDGHTLYEIASGTIAYAMTDPECTYAFAPSTVTWSPSGTVTSQLDHHFAATPIVFSGSASMFWMAQMTVSCPDGTSTVPQLIGGQFFRAETTPQSGEVLSDDYTLMGAYHYAYSFHR